MPGIYFCLLLYPVSYVYVVHTLHKERKEHKEFKSNPKQQTQKSKAKKESLSVSYHQVTNYHFGFSASLARVNSSTLLPMGKQEFSLILHEDEK